MFPFLQLWMDSGISKLKQFVANIGITLQDSQQSYKYLHPDQKKNMIKKICEACLKMEYPSLVCDSFVFQFDHRNSIDSFDMVHIMNSVLNHHKVLKDEVLKIENVNKKDLADNFNQEQNFWTIFQQTLDK